MKLSTITNENWRSTGSKLNYICGNCVCEDDYHNSKPISVLFVESTFATGLLSETETNALTTLFRAGMSKMQAAMTPNTAQDLDSLLTFVAPQGGGIAQVKSLIQAAKTSRGPIAGNQQWWDELFTTFGITDNNIKQAAIDQVTANTGQSAPEQPVEAPTEQPAEAPTEQPAEIAPQQTAAAPRDWLSDATQERQKVLDHQSRMADLLAQSKSMRQDTSQRLEALSKRLEELRSQGATESIATDYATALFEFPQVRNNLPAIVEMMVRSGGRRYALINEAGLNDRTNQAINAIPGFLNNLGQKAKDIVANPQYAASQFQASDDAHINERAAKLAILVLTNHVRGKFIQKLQAANATPQEIIADLDKFQGYQERLSVAGIEPESVFSPQELTEYRTLQKKLKSIYRLFNKDRTQPFKTPRTRPQPEPVTAELVDEQMPEQMPELPPSERLIDALQQQRLVPQNITTLLRKKIRSNPALTEIDIFRALLDRKLLTREQAFSLFKSLKNRS